LLKITDEAMHVTVKTFQGSSILTSSILLLMLGTPVSVSQFNR
jgi:hypothetical protein